MCTHIYLIPQDHELMDSVSVAYDWGFRKPGETRKRFSTTFDVLTVPVISRLSSSIHSQRRTGSDKDYLAITTKQT